MIGFKTDFKGSPMMRFQAGAPRMHNLVKSQTFWTMVIAAVAPFARRRRRGRLHANDPAQSRGLQRADLGAHGTSTLAWRPRRHARARPHDDLGGGDTRDRRNGEQRERDGDNSGGPTLRSGHTSIIAVHTRLDKTSPTGFEPGPSAICAR